MRVIEYSVTTEDDSDVSELFALVTDLLDPAQLTSSRTRQRAVEQMLMTTERQRQAARRNVKKGRPAPRAGRRSTACLASRTRTALGEEAAAVRRGDAPTRKELEAQARKIDIPGRSRTGKAELKQAVEHASR